MRAAATALALLVPLLLALPGAADLGLPPGFVAEVYVTGEGFDSSSERGIRGFPAAATLGFDPAGALYLARTGRRYLGGEADDLAVIYRIPPGGAKLTPGNEVRHQFGPPLPNPQIGGLRGQELLVTTFDRQRRIGVLYRMAAARTELLAGGTPPAGAAPLLRQPEGVVADAAGRLYVADRDQGVVLRLDAAGRVLDPRYLAVTRPRLLALDEAGALWVAADGPAEAPWQAGPGEIWRVAPDGTAALVLRGPLAAGLALSPAGHLVIADRQGARVFVLTADGRQVDFARMKDGSAPRGLVFAPATPETRRAGIAGDLFLVTITKNAWPVNEVVRIAGPFDDFVRRALAP
jgi:sugar lactone lactonase YvrE